MARTLYAHIETVARDCDGMHYRSADYNMEDSERFAEFGDMDFMNRILSYIVSHCARQATLTVTHDEENGTPIYEWSEATEEGFRNETLTFHDGSI